MRMELYGCLKGTLILGFNCFSDITEVQASRALFQLYRISSNKRPGAYLKLQLKGGALIGRRALNRGGRSLSFPFKEL